MGAGTKKIVSVKHELIELNNKFRDKVLLTDAFYKQLMHAGFAYNQCILVSIFPDGSSTYCGQIIRQDGNVVEFDIDLDFAEYSSWKDITDAFRITVETNIRSKPWLKEVVAFNLFCELGRTSKK
ncbi:MAG: hypothetical protein OEY09_09930 [Gammaproteobacteria bacterium]|nr:hypothetical protein [Gammaproteobacteria bacterium]